jgi:hypothetical protein
VCCGLSTEENPAYHGRDWHYQLLVRTPAVLSPDQGGDLGSNPAQPQLAVDHSLLSLWISISSCNKRPWTLSMALKPGPTQTYCIQISTMDSLMDFIFYFIVYGAGARTQSLAHAGLENLFSFYQAP